MEAQLDFEEHILELEGKIKELRHLSNAEDLNIAEEITRLQSKVDKLLKQTYKDLTPWQKVMVARHNLRPRFSYITTALFEDFTELAGDRTYGDDNAIIGGMARFRGQSVMLMGHEKGNTTQTRIKHNFGMAHPEGYRKAKRLMELADKFKMPLLTFVDTSGAYPGLGAESRGQSEAIARSIEAALNIKVPVISTVVGEGGSGGAIGIAVSNSVLMLEHAVYSVISPEGCASILWRDGDKKQEAAKAMNITAQDLKRLKLIDHIVAEPVGGAHRNPKETVFSMGDIIETELKKLQKLSGTELLNHRRDKFLAMGREL